LMILVRLCVQVTSEASKEYTPLTGSLARHVLLTLLQPAYAAALILGKDPPRQVNSRQAYHTDKQEKAALDSTRVAIFGGSLPKGGWMTIESILTRILTKTYILTPTLPTWIFHSSK